jgi:two-component system sensor histidine kinase ChvG
MPRADGVGHATLEPRLQAFWLQTSRGYHLEARIPRSMLGPRLWIEALDGAGGGGAGFMGAAAERGGRLFFMTPGLDALLATFIGPGTRATVVDTNALKLGQAGSLLLGEDQEPHTPQGAWYRRFMADDSSHWAVQTTAPDRLQGASVTDALAGRPSAEWLAGDRLASLLSAAAPITVAAQVRGAVVLEQAGDQYLDLRDRALTHLFNLTLLAMSLAVAVAFRHGELDQSAHRALAQRRRDRGEQ